MSEQRNQIFYQLLQYEKDNPNYIWLHGVLSLKESLEFDTEKLIGSLHKFFRGYLSVAYMDLEETHNPHIHFMLANTKEKIKRFEEKKRIYTNLNRWERVQLARHPKRPYSSDYIDRITNYWF